MAGLAVTLRRFHAGLFFFFVSFLVMQKTKAHASSCESLFYLSGHSVQNSGFTERLIAYLSQLLDGLDIGDRELRMILDGLDKGSFINPIRHSETVYGPVFEKAAHQIQYRIIEKHLKNPVDHGRIRVWAEHNLQEKGRVRERREEARHVTQDISHKMKFRRLPPGRFEMNDMDSALEVILTHEIEMMTTPVTQKMWAELMGQNPSEFWNGLETIELEINGNRISMQPDHPVENLTWWSAVVFANRLSEKMGLKPAYDLSNLKLDGHAEDGTLLAPAGEIRILAPDGDIYRAEGYRLPTEAEQEYVLRNLGATKTEFPHGLSLAELSDYGWNKLNSGGSTHAVGTTSKTLMVNGEEFHDLIGNTDEWSHDGYKARLFMGGENPAVFPSRTIDRILVGRSWYEFPQQALFGLRSTRFPDGRSSGIGLRLVRTLQ